MLLNMKTALIVCSDNRETLSHQFIDTLQENQVAQRVIASDFQNIEKHLHTCIDLEHIIVFPCTIGLSDNQLKDLQKRLQVVQKQHPKLGIHLANALGCDPRLSEMVQDRISTALKGTQNTPILTIEGLEDIKTLYFDDFKIQSDQIPDISTIIPDRKGEGIWARALLPDLPHAQATFYADDDRFSSSVALSLVRERGLFIYALDAQPLPVSFGGPLRLLIPEHNDRCANVKGVARIVISQT
jgi:hypothetical protein